MRPVVLLALAALLLAAPPALAKGELEAGAIVICGPSGCTPIDDQRTLNGVAMLPFGEVPAVAGDPPAASPYYELRWAGDGARFAWLVVDPGAVRPESSVGSSRGSDWYRLADVYRDSLAKTVQGLEPYPAPQLTKVYLDERQAPSVDPYLGLLGLGAEAYDPAASTPRITVGLVTGQPTPWTQDGSIAELVFAPEEDVLLVDGRWYEVPADLATRIERDAGLEPVPAPAEAPAPAERTSTPPVAASDDDGGPWSLVAALVIGAVALGSALVLYRRRTPGRHVPRGA
jgi:hypothetical protein